MMQHVTCIGSPFDLVFLILQALVLIFLLFRDWVPLGRLNNLSAIRGEDLLVRRIFVTLLPGVPAAVCLWLSARHALCQGNTDRMR